MVWGFGGAGGVGFRIFRVPKVNTMDDHLQSHIAGTPNITQGETISLPVGSLGLEMKTGGSSAAVGLILT